MDISKTLRNIVLFFLKFMAQCKTFIWRRMSGKWNLNGKWMQMLVTFILLIHPNKNVYLKQFFKKYICKL